MSLKKESFDTIKKELQRRVDKIPHILGVQEYGVTAEDMGLDDEFIERMINEAYLGIFTVEEVEEMVVFQKRFAERNLILEGVVEEAFAKVMENNKSRVLSKMKEGVKE